MNTLIGRIVVTTLLCLVSTTILAKGVHYSAESVISEAVTIFDDQGKPHKLRSLIQQQGRPVNVIFIFGGGGMGHERTQQTGGLWCQDSYEDLHILRSLKAAYDEKIGIFPIAIPPAHHTAHLGLTKGVFLNPDIESIEYQQAVGAFIASTQEVFEAGTIPVQPFYDTQYDLLASHDDLALRKTIEPWHGGFRAANETQTYGVPSIWIVGGDGRILREPFRGNDYHGHGNGIVINYTLSDVVAALNSLD